MLLMPSSCALVCAVMLSCRCAVFIPGHHAVLFGVERVVGVMLTAFSSTWPPCSHRALRNCYYLLLATWNRIELGSVVFDCCWTTMRITLVWMLQETRRPKRVYFIVPPHLTCTPSQQLSRRIWYRIRAIIHAVFF